MLYRDPSATSNAFKKLKYTSITTGYWNIQRSVHTAVADISTFNKIALRKFDKHRALWAVSQLLQRCLTLCYKQYFGQWSQGTDA